jgi:large subunit ribosomal protein L29
MAIIKKKDMKKLDDRELDKKLSEMRLELAKQRASVKIGATVTSPGRIREIRKTLARGLTIKNQRQVERKKELEGPDGKKQASPASTGSRLRSK